MGDFLIFPQHLSMSFYFVDPPIRNYINATAFDPFYIYYQFSRVKQEGKSLNVKKMSNFFIKWFSNIIINQYQPPLSFWITISY